VQREQTTWEWGRSIGHSANDHLFALDHLLTQRELKAGDHLLLIGVGPGLNLATAVIEIMDQPQWLH
jgi:3-oxoacyl-[acyl-carrier-protein] synthase III